MREVCLALRTVRIKKYETRIRKRPAAALDAAGLGAVGRRRWRIWWNERASPFGHVDVIRSFDDRPPAAVEHSYTLVFVIQHDAHSYSYFVSSMMLERGTVDIGEHAPLSLLRQGVFPFRPATAHDQACYRSQIEAFDYYLSSFHLFRATP